MPGPPGGHGHGGSRTHTWTTAVSRHRAVTRLLKLFPDKPGLQVPLQNTPGRESPTCLARRPHLQRQKQSWLLSKEEE